MEAAGAAAFGLFFMAYFGFIVTIVVVGWAGYIAAALAIYDCAQREFESPETRAAWCVVLFIGQWLSAIIYYFAVYKPNTPPRIDAHRE